MALFATVDVFEFSRHRIRRLKLRRFANKLMVCALDEEAASGQDWPEVLTKLHGKHALGDGFTAVVLPPELLDLHTIQTSDDDPDELADAVQHQLRHHSGHEPVRWTTIPLQDDTHLLVSDEQDVTGEIVRSMNAFGARPVYVGSGIESIGFAFGFDKEQHVDETDVLHQANGLEHRAHVSSGATIGFSIASSQSNDQLGWRLPGESDSAGRFLLGESSVPTAFCALAGVALNLLFSVNQPASLLDEKTADEAGRWGFRKSLGRLAKPAAIAAGALWVAIGGAYWIQHAMIDRLERENSEQYAIIRQMEQSDRERQRLRESVQELEQSLGVKTHANEYLEVITRTIPAHAQLTDLTIGESGDVSLQGLAEDSQVVADFLEALGEYPSLGDVRLKTIKLEKQSGMAGSVSTVARFHIEIEK